MEVTILHQPYDSDGALCRLGTDIVAELTSGLYNEVHILSAFVTSSGTQRIGPALGAMTCAGGRVRALIGVNNGITSGQAVEDLCAAGVEVLGFHTGGSILYHPKVYLLRGPNCAWLSVGSSNLTGDGMYRNIETNTILRLDLGRPEDVQVADETEAWFQRFRNVYAQNTLHLSHDAIAPFVRSGTLVDEIARARQNRSSRAPRGAGRRGRPAIVAPFVVPALPTTTGRRPVHQRRGARVGRENSTPTPGRETRFFAMILSAHDASKRTGTPGTPELSLPRAATDFFPLMSRAGRQYPDAYFDVRLNIGLEARIVNYRIWERPAGGAAGHADLRINIKHETVDLTTDGGGDVILFEVSPDVDGPAYEVWIVRPVDANYDSIRSRCNQQVVARGAGEIKRFGFF